MQFVTNQNRQMSGLYRSFMCKQTNQIERQETAKAAIMIQIMTLISNHLQWTKGESCNESGQSGFMANTTLNDIECIGFTNMFMSVAS